MSHLMKILHLFFGVSNTLNVMNRNVIKMLRLQQFPNKRPTDTYRIPVFDGSTISATYP